MNIRIESITEKNENEVLQLETAEGQEGFVESVEECLAESRVWRQWKPVAIYDDTQMVGFAMYGYLLGRVWFDRLLIDQRFQGRGYGRKAVEALLLRIHKEYPQQSQIYLSVVEGNDQAAKLYQDFGFAFNGERDTKGEHVMVKMNRS